MVKALPSFKDITTIIIKPSESESDLNRCIEATKRKLKDLAPSKEKRYLRVWYEGNDDHFRIRYYPRVTHKSDITAYVHGYYSEVPI